MIIVSYLTEGREIRVKGDNKGGLRCGVLVPRLLCKSRISRKGINFLDSLLYFARAVSPGDKMLLEFLRVM